jgi:hypothetical protein
MIFRLLPRMAVRHSGPWHPGRTTGFEGTEARTMSRPIPSYWLHKAIGQAIVTIAGRDI